MQHLFNIYYSALCPQTIYEFRVILRTNIDYFPEQLIIVTEKLCVSSDVGDEFLSVIQVTSREWSMWY
jgi:hypothetical protein